MRRTIIFFVIIFCLLQNLIWGLNNEVGEILSLQGSCRIDSFGTGEFIIPRQGDKLYVTTQLETLSKATMHIRIFEEEMAIPEETCFSLKSYLKIHQKNQDENWFSPVWDLIQRATDSLFHDEEHVDLVTRGQVYLAENAQLFAWKDEPGVSSYGDEIQLLKYLLGNHGRVDSETGEVVFKDNSMEIYYLMGAVHLKNRNFMAAIENLKKAIAIMDALEKPPLFNQKARLFLSIAFYFNEEIKTALEILKRINITGLDRELRIIANWILEEQYLARGEKQPPFLIEQLEKDIAGNAELEKAHSGFLKARIK